MIFFQQLYLDREKDIAVDLFLEGEQMLYCIRTPNHHTGNLITNLAALCGLKTEADESGLKVIRGEVPCYFDGDNRRMYILRLGNTKVANIFPDGTVELKASIPAISKTLMSQTKDYRLGEEKTIVKTYIRSECKFRTDLHTHMNGNLPPDALIALGIIHQISYPYYYVKKLGLGCTAAQRERLETARNEALSAASGKKQADRLACINFAELILGNPGDAQSNISLIRNSLTIPKDGQAVFSDLEKVYQYRYVFTKGKTCDTVFSGLNIEGIPDREVLYYARKMQQDDEDERYRANTIFQDLLLWIAREYKKHGIAYAEISDTALLKPEELSDRLRQIHEIMPAITRETGVVLRFLAGIRRIPLTIVQDQAGPNDYLAENLRCLKVIAADPYVAGSDIIGEEINDILELKGMIRELVAIAGDYPGFVIRIHAGENDSLRDNVANSIKCVADALEPGQPMPGLRLGHGLYTCDLGSAKGKRLLEEMRSRQVVLEFQITSNVRLNNLSHLDKHPLRQYLKAGIRCVQGTDGSALYGTNSIDEELSLEKLLGLSHEELCQMRQAEEGILKESLLTFERKTKVFQEECPAGDVERFYRKKLENIAQERKKLWSGSGKEEAGKALNEQMSSIPKNLFPIVIGGGSFNNSAHRSALSGEDRAFIDRLVALADPEKGCFVVGHSRMGQEGYLIRQAAGRFKAFAIVPTLISPAEKRRLIDAGLGIMVSIESTGMGLYKSFGYEVFDRYPSALLAFDGNSAAQNLIQEARNGKKKCRIFINPRSRSLQAKARLLEGYVQPLKDAEAILAGLGLIKN